MVTIRQADSAEDVRATRRLFVAYARSLDFDLDFQHFEQELADLPGCYEPPTGCTLLAVCDSEPVGCVALRPLDARVCEMKRLFVVPDSRGEGTGKALALAVLARARVLGYDRMRLDTVTGMVAANTLYASLGFVRTEPYRHNPLPDASFFELELQSAVGGGPLEGGG